METGTVAFWNYDKGYGFILPDFGDKQVFAHISQVEGKPDDVPEGARVSYEIGEGRRPGSVQAIKIQIEGNR